MSVTIIVEITNKLLRHVSTQEESSSGSWLVLAKITYWNVQVVRLKFVIKSIKLIKITNCDVASVYKLSTHTTATSQPVQTRPPTYNL